MDTVTKIYGFYPNIHQIQPGHILKLVFGGAQVVQGCYQLNIPSDLDSSTKNQFPAVLEVWRWCQLRSPLTLVVRQLEIQLC